MKKVLAIVMALALLLALAPCAFAAKDKGYKINTAEVTTYPRPLGGTAVQIYIEVENTSEEPLYFQTGDAELEDADENLIGMSSSVSVCPQIVQPGDLAYYTDVIYFDDPIDYVPELYFKPSAKPATLVPLELEISGLSFSLNSLNILKALGRVKNNSGEDVEDLISIAVLLYDEEENFLGKLSTTLSDDLEDGDRAAFELSGLMLPGNIKPEDIANFKAFAYPRRMQY